MDPLTAIVVLVAAFLVSSALAPKPTQPPAASLGDFTAPTADETRQIPVIFGERWVTGPNVIWYGDLKSQAIRKKGGKK